MTAAVAEERLGAGTQRRNLSWLLEEHLVAGARFAAARRRVGRSQAKAGLADLEIHRAEMHRVGTLYHKAGGDIATEDLDRQQARRIALLRIKGDKAAGRCLCSASCGKEWR